MWHLSRCPVISDVLPLSRSMAPPHGHGGIFRNRAPGLSDLGIRPTCAEAPSPATVRYAWADWPEVNLENSAGLPAEPFRTDTP